MNKKKPTTIANMTASFVLREQSTSIREDSLLSACEFYSLFIFIIIILISVVLNHLIQLHRII